MIQIITDNTTGFSAKQLQDMQVISLPLTVHFGEDQYRDGIDLTNEEFYKKLSECEILPHTSQINPFEFADCFRPYVEQGDDIVGLFISSGISGTYQSACIAKEELENDRIFLPDTLAATFGQAILVQIAVQLREEGKTAEEIYNTITELAKRLRLVAMVDTLKYLKMGGRISASTALIGNMLGINPLVSLVDGKVESIGKVRGKKAAFRFMKDYTEQHPIDLSYPVTFGNSACEDKMQKFMTYMGLSLEHPHTSDLGAVIGTHIGPGAVGIAYIEKE